MNHYYPNVPGLGNVAVSRHALARMEEAGVTAEQLESLLNEPTRSDVEDGAGTLLRERNGLRAVILRRPTPFRGAMLVKTVYRVQPALRAH